MNTAKTAALLTGMTVLLVFAGGALGGSGGMVIAFIFALVMNAFSYWFSDKIILKMYKAREASEQRTSTSVIARRNANEFTTVNAVAASA